MSAQASGGLSQQSLLATGLGTSGFLAGLSGTGMLGQQSAGGSSSLQSTSIGQSIGGGLKLGQTPLLGGLNKGSTLTTTTGQSGSMGLLGLPTAGTTGGVGLSIGGTGLSTAGTTGGVGLSVGGMGLSTAGTTGGVGLSIGGTGLSTAGTTVGVGLSIGGTGLSTAGTTGGVGLSVGGTGLSTAGTTGGVGLSVGGTGLSTAGTLQLASGLSLSTSTAESSTESSSGPKSILDQELPPELNQLANQFVAFLGAQKEHQKQLVHFNDKNMNKVASETTSLKQRLNNVSMSVQRDGHVVVNLKKDNLRTVHFAEIAQQTHEVPPSLQYEHSAPLQYFQWLIDNFDVKMRQFSRQIIEMESHLRSISLEDIDPNIIVNVLQVQHKTFVALASHLQSLHEAIQSQCALYLQYRRSHFNDSTDVFSERRKMKKIGYAWKDVKKGPTPFKVPPPYQYNFGYVQQPLHSQQMVSTGLTTRLTSGPMALSSMQPSTSLGIASKPLAPPTVGLNQSQKLMGTSGSEFQLKPPPLSKKFK